MCSMKAHGAFRACNGGTAMSDGIDGVSLVCGVVGLGSRPFTSSGSKWRGALCAVCKNLLGERTIGSVCEVRFGMQSRDWHHFRISKHACVPTIKFFWTYFLAFCS